jgi:PAS domain-containing protein
LIGALVSVDTTAATLPLAGFQEHPASPEPVSPIRILDAIELLADGYYEMDTGFRYRRINPAGLRIAGKTADEIIGKHVLEVFPDIVESAIHQTTVRVMETREAASVETYYPRTTAGTSTASTPHQPPVCVSR